jgi:hypothetical protein
MSHTAVKHGGVIIPDKKVAFACFVRNAVNVPFHELDYTDIDYTDIVREWLYGHYMFFYILAYHGFSKNC